MKPLAQNITITICGAAAALLLVFFAVKPVLSDVGTLHGLVVQAKTESLALAQQILAFKTAQSDLSKATRKDEIAAVIPAREGLTPAVLDLETAVKKANVDHTLQISNEVKGNQVLYELNTTSDFLGALSLLSYLEHSPHFTEMQKINLSAETTQSTGSKATHTGRVLGDFKGVFFIKPSP